VIGIGSWNLPILMFSGDYSCQTGQPKRVYATTGWGMGQSGTGLGFGYVWPLGNITHVHGSLPSSLSPTLAKQGQVQFEIRKCASQFCHADAKARAMPARMVNLPPSDRNPKYP